MLKTQQSIQREIDEETSVDDLIQLARELFQIDAETSVKLIVSNFILSNQRPILQQRVCEGATIIVNARSARRVEAPDVEAEQLAPLSEEPNNIQNNIEEVGNADSQGSELPETYSEHLARQRAGETSTNQQQHNESEAPLLRLDRSKFPFSYFTSEAPERAEEFAMQLSENPGIVQRLTEQPELRARLSEFCGGRGEDGDLSADEIVALTLESAQTFGGIFTDEDGKAYEEKQLQMLREMGELDDQYDIGDAVDDTNAPVGEIDYAELRTKYGEELQVIKDMGVQLGDEEILQMLEIAAGNVEIVINEIFGM